MAPDRGFAGTILALSTASFAQAQELSKTPPASNHALLQSRPQQQTMPTVNIVIITIICCAVVLCVIQVTVYLYRKRARELAPSAVSAQREAFENLDAETVVDRLPGFQPRRSWVESRDISQEDGEGEGGSVLDNTNHSPPLNPLQNILNHDEEGDLRGV
mmetsp:Transcript_566/g.986  ORF Transcript_566/g.986 Transcript_566/m.986 type:complete len:160 (+) Transcript_566:71-550(+)